MADYIIPSFIDFPVEGAMVGRLLAGYGELELELCQCVAAVTRNIDDVIRKLFNLRGEKRRIDWADNLARAPYMKAGLGSDYKTVITICIIVENYVINMPIANGMAPLRTDLLLSI